MSAPNGYARSMQHSTPDYETRQVASHGAYHQVGEDEYEHYMYRYPIAKPSDSYHQSNVWPYTAGHLEYGQGAHEDEHAAVRNVSDYMYQMTLDQHPPQSSQSRSSPQHAIPPHPQHQQPGSSYEPTYQQSSPHYAPHTMHRPHQLANVGSQGYDLELHGLASRPVSSSASGIISLYTEDHTGSSQYSSPNLALQDCSDFVSHHQGATVQVSPSAIGNGGPIQQVRRAARPLPVTPAKSHNASLPVPKSPTGQSFMGVNDFVAPVESDNYKSRLQDSQGYFSIASPHLSNVSQPTTPSSILHSSTSSISSRTYPAPPWSPSSSVQGTPRNVSGHRPLPSTASTSTSFDRSLSPPPKEAPAPYPLSALRSVSLSQHQMRHGIPTTQVRSNSTQRKESSYSQTHRIASTSQMMPQIPPYDPVDSLTQSSNHASSRQRTHSDVSGLLYRSSKSQRHPLPPLPAVTSQWSGQKQPAQADVSLLDRSTTYQRPQANASQQSLQDIPSNFARSASYRDDRDLGDSGLETRPSISRREMEYYNRQAGDSSAASVRGTGLHSQNAEVPRHCSSSSVTIDWSLLSTIALLLRANVPRGTQIKGSIDYPKSFTGKDVVSTLQALISSSSTNSEHTIINFGGEQEIRQVALLLAKSLKSQLFFHEVDWGENELNDGVDEVYTFLEDSLAGPTIGSDEAEDWTAGLHPTSGFDLSLQLSISRADESKGRRGKRVTVKPSDLDELPNGVFTLLTQCYSPLCTTSTLYRCYSPSCPNSSTSPLRKFLLNSMTTQNGKGVAVGQAFEQMQSKAWAEMVPQELLKNIPQAEIARQNAILETIQKEEEFLLDLELLDSLFVKGLQKPSDAGDPPPLPIGAERDEFIREVFGNHLELASHIRALVERLHIRQREENPIVQSIGDIFLSAALDWGEAYIKYLINYPLAISRVKREIAINPRFKAFVEACRRHPAAHKHPLENFLFRPPARLQRYHLHLESILKKTEEANTDRASLENAIEIINDQCKTAQAGVETSELKVTIREYAYNLSSKRNKGVIDMDLLNPERQLVHQGRVLRKPDAFDFDWTELLAILFDNYFIVAKQKRASDGLEDDNPSSTSSSGTKFVLAKRPIPVEMLEVSGISDASISRSIGLSNFHIREREARDFWPFTVSHLGGKVEPITLYAPSKQARTEWKQKLDEAISLRLAVQDSSKVFEQQMLSEDVFAIAPLQSLEPERPVPGVDSSVFHGRVTCAVPFITVDGRRLVAVGCADGVWIGLRNDPKSLRKVLHLKSVSQCAVLESFGIFVVLADKVLISYSLEALVPTSSSVTSSLRPPQKLSGNRDVLFFNVGVLKDRTLLIYMKKKANESVFRALEPVLNAPRTNEAKSGSGFFGKFGKDSKNSDWFRIYKTFFIPSEAYSIQFLKSKLCIICAKGFEIMNLDSLLPGTIPDFVHASREDPRVLSLQKRVETAKPLGMYKTADGDFLLCYDTFACYVDRLGEPIRMEQTIEWEGFPKQVAFSGNFVLAFDPRFIEIRDTLSGRLVQIVRGSDLRYISGNSTITTSLSESALLSALDADTNPVILTKRERAAGRVPFDFQRVIELSPTGPPQAHAYSSQFTRSATIMSSSSRVSALTPGQAATPSTWL